MMKRTVKKQEETFNPFEPKDNTAKLMASLDKIDQRNIRTRFKNAQDPINLAFNTIENTPLKNLAQDFIKESFFDIISFITEGCNK